ncbi:fructose-6-phosphate aldolase [Candidatus Dependentiae bacterium]|nr:fructose-6-phosphate aldolase [Tatlockia sp.]MBA3954916.1 fructose-6-phosphate aldolase [Candidatus Dependentiae bacterium]
MKLFLDSANVDSIKKGIQTGLVDGITTNPTLLSKESGNLRDLLVTICKTVYPHDVSIEVTERDPQALYEQAKTIAQIAPNVVVKIPCYTEYLPVIKKLVAEGVGINITLLFSAVQGLLMGKLGVKYISPFVGRLDDIDSDGLQLIKDLRTIYNTYGVKTQILAASLRSVSHVHQVALAGADIATLPVTLFESLADHPLTTKGMAKFEEDWHKLGISKFP